MASKLRKNKKVLIIAEVGLNHNGDYSLAVRSIKEAAKAGADAVKFQNFRTEDFIFGRSLTFTYKSRGKKVRESMWDLCKRCEMKKGWLKKLKRQCDKLGVIFLSTPTSEEGVKALVDIGVPMLKNGSDYLTNLSLLKYMGSTGLPVIISTGMADKPDVKDAVNAVRSGDKSAIVLMHCTSSYPTAPAEVNLNKMLALRDTFKTQIGFSDHTMGSLAAVQAVTLGACMIEKHFTLNHDLPGPDHWFSMDPVELRQYVKDIREAELRMGKYSIEPTENEKINRNDFRLSLMTSKDLPAGHIIRRQNFVISKPGTGLSPKEAEKIIGKKIIKNIPKGTPLLWKYFR